MTKLPVIIDDFLDEDLQSKIEDLIFDCNWKFQIDNCLGSKTLDQKYRKFLSPFEYQINPTIISDVINFNQLFKLFLPIIKNACKKINYEIDEIVRCISVIHFLQREGSKIDNIHVNRKEPHLVMIYYVIDSDGDTILYDKTVNDIPHDIPYPEYDFNLNIVKKVSPKKGRILFFDGETYHASSSPSKINRCIITTDIFGKFTSEKNIFYQ